MNATTPLSLVVEGACDEPVARRIAAHAGFEVDRVHGGKGRPWVLENAPRFNLAARWSPWFLLIDLDDDPCAPRRVAATVPKPEPRFALRIAVRELEAWLLADRERLAAMLKLDAALIPTDPERLTKPKRSLFELAAKSGERRWRDGVPPHSPLARMGPLYLSFIREFVDLDDSNPATRWRVEVAMRSASSLARCVKALRKIATTGRG